MIFVLSLAVFIASLDMFVVNVALGAIGHDMPLVPLSDLAWVLNGYTIFYGALLVPAGRLADLLGKKEAFLAGLMIFLAASAGCAASHGVEALVVFRCIQAAGAALLTPASMGIVVAAFPVEVRPRAVRIWAASGALAGAAGPVVGGFLAAYGWPWIFLINVPVCLVAILLGAYILPAQPPVARADRFDLLGCLLLIVASGAVALGLVNASRWGETLPALATWLTAFLAVLLLCRRVAKHPTPIVSRALLCAPHMGYALMTIFVMSLSFGALLLGASLYLEAAVSKDLMVVGLLIAPGPCVVGLISLLTKRTDLAGLYRRVKLGAVVLACSSFALALVVSRQASVAWFVVAWIFAGVGVGLVFPNLFAIGVADLGLDLASTGSGVINMSRQLGTTVGTSLLVMTLGSNANAFAEAFWIAGASALVGFFWRERRLKTQQS
ncbi:Multidrug resistance protein Stp [Pandoraea capi]|uniref:Multidrug resistance protein Stp n=2 Tax=Pandoraea capi TaxID=2508286 RepID=A0ABY6W9D6_9BURK|nr:Multidrug resistance protein Stp [Pandoraea capi]